MVLGFGETKSAPKKRPDDVPTLIAKKDYARAIQQLKHQLEKNRHDSRLRLQLGDLLVLTGRSKEAVAILTPLAEEFAAEGFAAKAISVFKKIQKIDPTQQGVDEKLAALIEDKQRVATVAPPPAASLPEFGMEEIGLEAEAVSIPAREPEPEPPPPRPATPVPLPLPVEDRDLIDETADTEPEAALQAESQLPPEIELDPEPELQMEPEIALEPEIEPDRADEPVLEPMSESLFADELMSLVEGAFNDPAAAAAAPAAPSEGGGNQIVVSPLFKDFSVDELVAVIQGLNLITFEAGDIILTEGDPGDSLYMLTSGTVKAVRRNAAGRQVAVNEISEGAFFGEISILTGQPRTATIVATSHCELLELDRATLDSIVATHPHVRQVLEQFSKERLASLPRR